MNTCVVGIGYVGLVTGGVFADLGNEVVRVGVALATDLDRLRAVARRPAVLDGRNLWEPERMRRLGFECPSVGRKPVLPP